MKKIITLIFILFFAFKVQAQPISNGGNYTVGSGGYFPDLPTAVSVLNADPVNHTGVIFTITDPTITIPTLTISKSVTIQGAAENADGSPNTIVYLQSDQTDRHFRVGGSSLVDIAFKGLAIIGPNATYVINAGVGTANPTGGTTIGGGVEPSLLAFPGSLSIENCVVAGCKTSSNGGGMNLSVTSSVHYTQFYLKGVVVSAYNYSEGRGGGICFAFGTVNIQTTSLLIKGNTSNTGGGGFFLGGILASPTTFTCTAANNVVIDSNISNIGGGGIYGDSFANAINLTGAIITNNKSFATTISGGTAGGGGIGTRSALSLNNCTITGNTTGYLGGGVYSTNSVNVSNNTNITENSSISDGGGIYVGTTLTLNNSTISNNKAGYNATTATWQTAGDGGGAYVIGSLNLQGTVTLQNDTTANSGGAIYKSATASTSISCSTDLVLNISNNVARTGSGGGISTQFTTDFSNAQAITINNNTCKSTGGGIYSSGGTLTLKNATVSFNRAGYGYTNATDANPEWQTIGDGGAIYANNNLVLQGNITCKSDTAAANGGAIYKSTTGGTSISSSSNLSLNVSNNVARTASGGGIMAQVVADFSNAQAITINNNISGDRAGGILGIAALTLANATISNNKAGYSIITNTFVSGTINGGGIYANNALTLIGNMQLENNQALTEGAGIWKGSSGAFTATGLTSLIINQNSTINGEGGGIYTLISLDLSNASTVTITNNTAASNGGGIRNGTGATLTIVGGNILNNIAKMSGGGIYGFGIINLKNMTITGNKAGYDITNTTTPWQATGDGGGVFAFNNLILQGIITCQNDTAANNGGAIYKGSAASSSISCSADLVLNINNNAALNGNGGGMNTQLTANLSNAQTINVNNNIAKGSGGGIFANAPLMLNNSTVSNNKAGYDLPTKKWTGAAAYRGGGVYAVNTLTLTGNIVFRKDTVSGAAVGGASVNPGGGGIYTASPLTIDAAAGLISLLIDSCAAINPTDPVASNNSTVGGGIFVNTGGNLTLKGSPTVPITISNCSSLSWGGGIFVRGSGTTLDYVTITGNQGILSNAGGICGDSNVSQNFFDINHSTITNNTARSNGGGIWTNNNVPITIANTTISNNKAGYDITTGSWQATGDGGGLYSSSALTLKNTIVCQNDTAAGNGGAIYKASGTFDVSALNSLTANANTAINSSGGAIYTAAALTLSNKIGAGFSYNTAGTTGGAVASTAALELDSLSILNNKAGTLGGGVYSSAKFTSIANTYANNRATDGGGIYSAINSASNMLTVKNNTFSQNTATGNGGALYASTAPAGSDTIVFSSFNGNSATNGQAIYLNSTANKTFNGNIIYGNGNGNEVMPISGIPGNYNIVRGTSPFTGTGNSAIGTGRVQEIFSNVLSNDLAVLQNNGGPTQTLKILRNGLASNFIPQSTSWLSAIATDQTGAARVKGCAVDAGSVELQVTDPATSKWIGGGNISDWNDPANWENRDSNGNLIADPTIPSRCSNVIIPENTTAYPILQKVGTVIPSGEGYAQTICDTITFKFGGEVAKTNYLQYNFAKVDLTLNKDEWYTLSPVLQQQYSGDYLENGSQYRINPEISIMYYQTSNPQTGAGKVASQFTGLYNKNDELLKIATGHALWVDEGNRPESQFTIHLPKDSTKYAYYFVGNNQVSRWSGTMTRDKSGRFIYEGNTSYQSNGDGTFAQTIENSNDFPQVIVGNPYMSHLDVVEFQRQNSAYLSKSFRIWKGGTSYETYLINNDGTITGTDNDFQVSPMQSVIFNTEQRFTSPLTFTPAMSITKPGQTLRSASQPMASDVLRVEILRKGVRQSGMVLHYEAEASRSYNKNKDVWTIIPQNVGSSVTLYSVIDGGAASIYTTGDIKTPIYLDVAVGNTIKKSISNGTIETYTIRIAPNEENQLNGKDIYLYDSKYNTTHNLTKEGDYNFQNTTGDITGRFRLFAGEKVPTGIDQIPQNNNIYVVYKDKQVFISSSAGDPIREVFIFNLQGQLVKKETSLDTNNWSTFVSNPNKVIMVKVRTEKNDKTVKIKTE